MNRQDEMKLTLYQSTVDVIAAEGLEKATTRAIATNAGLNEAYIYRLYKDKDDLFKNTFDTLDTEFFETCYGAIDINLSAPTDTKERFYKLFCICWSFILGNKNKCLAFVRYYYSPYFAKYSLEDHKKRYHPIVDKFATVLREEANVWMLLKHIFNVMFDFAIKVYNGEVPDNEDTQMHVFILIYSSIKPYFRSN